MDTRTRARVGIAVVVSLAAVGLAVLGLSMVYGFAVEYGGGSFADLALPRRPDPGPGRGGRRGAVAAGDDADPGGGGPRRASW